MTNVKIGEFKVGDKLIIDYGDNNVNNKNIEIRSIVDMQIVVYIDESNNYKLETISYFNLLCRYGNLLRLNDPVA